MTGNPEPIRVGTRGSLLARTQTEQVLDAVRKKCPDASFDTTVIMTSGDESSGKPRPPVGSTGNFTREIEDALLSGSIDIAIHSLKDLPTDMPTGLKIVAIPERADPRDAVIGMTRAQLGDAEGDVRIGTSSLRRASQLRRLFPSSSVVPLRGNVDTRLRKVSEGQVDCAILALAGLMRVGREDEVSSVFDTTEMLPAPAQGALAVQAREDDERAAAVLRTIHSESSAVCVTAEREFMKRLGGGCHVPVAALATREGNVLQLKGCVVSLDGSRVCEETMSGAIETGVELGQSLADSLLNDGAADILAEIEDGSAER